MYRCPLFIKCDKFFMRAIQIIEGAKTFLTPKLSLAQSKGKIVEAPFENHLEMADYVFCQHLKNNIGRISNQWYNFISFYYLIVFL